jgi:hypothetical protein
LAFIESAFMAPLLRSCPIVAMWISNLNIVPWTVASILQCYLNPLDCSINSINIAMLLSCDINEPSLKVPQQSLACANRSLLDHGEQTYPIKPFQWILSLLSHVPLFLGDKLTILFICIFWCIFWFSCSNWNRLHLGPLPPPVAADILLQLSLRLHDVNIA